NYPLHVLLPAQPRQLMSHHPKSETIHLLDRWRAGDQQAAADLFARYAERLLALARDRLSSQLAPRLDPQDVVQSACGSLFIGVRDGRYVLQQSGDLWRLLAAITLHKVRQKARHHTADKRSVRREQELRAEGVDDFPPELLAREPAPGDVVSLA